MAPALISVYVETSTLGMPFKPRCDYRVNWESVVSASRECGLIEMIERTFDGVTIRTTFWTEIDSYSRWLNHPEIAEYLRQRDEYNTEHGIISRLTTLEVADEI